MVGWVPNGEPLQLRGWKKFTLYLIGLVGHWQPPESEGVGSNIYFSSLGLICTVYIIQLYLSYFRHFQPL